MHGTVRRTNQRIRSKRMRLTDQSSSERGIRKGRFSPGYKTGNTKGASVNQGLELRHYHSHRGNERGILANQDQL